MFINIHEALKVSATRSWLPTVRSLTKVKAVLSNGRPLYDPVLFKNQAVKTASYKTTETLMYTSHWSMCIIDICTLILNGMW